MCCLPKTHFKHKHTDGLKVMVWKQKTYHANTNPKNPGGAILISDKVDFTASKLSGIKRPLYKGTKSKFP